MNRTKPLTSVILWVMPLIVYILGKLAGVNYNEYEYIWYIVVPALFVLWLYANFKIIRR
jgi:hypothetical protein